MRVRVGTSGFAYKEWKGSFYPEDLPQTQMLRYYSGKLDTVEINNTFYRMPRESVLVGWAETTADDFSFVLKASRRITHIKRLKDAGDELQYLLRTAAVLGERLGPILFQLPPNMKKDLERLLGFLALFRGNVRPAFEFRNATWFDEGVYDALRRHDAALVVSDTDDTEEPPVVPTTGFGYLRLRRETYGESDLASWVSTIAGQPWESAWVFFKHEDAGAGPRLAARFREIFTATVAPDSIY